MEDVASWDPGPRLRAEITRQTAIYYFSSLGFDPCMQSSAAGYFSLKNRCYPLLGFYAI